MEADRGNETSRFVSHIISRLPSEFPKLCPFLSQVYLDFEGSSSGHSSGTLKFVIVEPLECRLDLS